ncbi:alpha/beta fold hydrolase [Fredinandcohnia sp. QZ13]|uniref:alpha/beta hydrolase n=1 Tax=Fredinandcohnia sp. QZ13 TaxID=3073144 RepID=UPI002852FDE2|nr:alpha/beta fold hydrolase [Fredinandcohnia sp. QZ13]MDR4888266.1 alpha/beta fold hydrolase [Fredinandcohnia sp. QZ13]
MIGCLFIHGFTGAPYEIEPLATYIRHSTDWVVRTPTLPGHGETLALKGRHYSEWIEHAERELVELLHICDKVFVVGFSMGGLIAGYLATRYPIQKLVLLSAAAYYINPKQLVADIRIMLRDGLNKNLHKNELYLRYKKKIVDTPLSATIEFRKLVRKIRPELRLIKVPTLIVQGECDGIVPMKSAHYLHQVISSTEKKLLFFPCAKHHVCYGEDQERLFEEVDSFLHEQTKECIY